MNQSNEISKFTEPDQDNAQPRTRRATRKHAASLRSTKEKEPGAASILEMSDAGPVETSRPLRTVKDLNHQMNSDQRLMTELEEESKSNEEANASTEIDEERPKRGRKNNSGDKLTQLDNTPAAKKPRRTNQSRSFGPTMEKESGASATSKATGKEHVKTSSQAKGRPSKTPSISQSPKRKKPLAVLSSNQKKENLEQIQRKSPRSSVTGVTDLQLSPQEDLVEDRQIARESEDNHSITPPNPRRKAKRKYVPNGLAPIGPPPSPPQIPDGLKGKWTYSEETRLFLADFRDITQVPDQDVKFLLELMARDDLVVVSEGLWGSTFETLMQLEYLEAAFGHQIHHKFRMFSKKKEGGYEEKPDGLSMRAKDFFRYLQKKMANDDDDDDQRSFLFTDGDGKCHEINVDDVSVYMIDCDLPKILPLLYDKYLSHCKMPEILPGGEMCMMNAMNHSGRPFMGPNLYVAPGGGFTSLHQDGEGTVDSGHSCISGYNEVVMLRRMPEEHKHYAAEQLGYDGVHRLPHDIGTTYKNVWPKKSVIEKWKSMKPGQHLHINKGRLHTFRKVKAEPLDEDDCHHDLRKVLLEDGLSKRDELCISVAFDWMFLGHSREAIDEEVRTSLRCAEICREVGSSSLGIPETCLLGLAGLLSRDAGTIYNELLHPIRRAACQGILPHLKGVVDREIKSGRGISKKAKLPDSQRNPDSYGIDPFGSDYFCFTCKRELANSYFHCLGCESLLQKDLNICRMCLEEKKHGKNIYMGFKGKTRNSDIIHAGVLEKKRNTRGCMCRQGICRDCGYCKSCSCSCHHDFQLHYRFYMPDELKDIAKRVEEIAARPNDDQIETCAGELQENCSNLPDSTNSPMQKTRPVDQAENRDAGPIVNHDVLPACTSKLQENHSTFPGPVDPSTQKALTQPNDQAEDRDAGHSMNHNVLPAPSVAFTCKTTPQLNVKTNAFSNTPKDLPPITEDVPAFPKYYTDVKTDYA